MDLDRHTRRALIVQRETGRLFAPLLIPLLTFTMRWVLGYKIRDVHALREQYRALMRESGERPILICGNHLTMIDSAIITCALGSSAYYATHFSALAWNMPERRNFASVWILRVLVYLLKCVPVVRGGKREDVAHVLGCVEYLLAKGEPVMLFPEGGRSRTGRVDTEAPAHGVGRLISSVAGCRVLCVYARGDHQATWSNIPMRGETFSVSLSVLEPHSEHTGMRRSRDYAHQVAEHLAQMEERYFTERHPQWAQRSATDELAAARGA
ncbi:MAG TPA: lysophospholipid acyltransferase family protein [Polyangiales bacterium]